MRNLCFKPEENELAEQVGRAEGDWENNLLLTDSEGDHSRWPNGVGEDPEHSNLEQQLRRSFEWALTDHSHLADVLDDDVLHA